MIVVPRNPIEVAQELQWEIDLAHPEVAPSIAQNAIDVLGDVREIYQSRRLLIHTLGAYVLDRGRTVAERRQMQFNELFLSGYFAGISYVQGGIESHFQSLVVDMFDVRIYRPVVAEDPRQGRLDAPLTIPVNDIQSVMVAA